MRGDIFEFIKSNLNSEEIRRVERYLRRIGKSDFSMENVPDCFGFNDNVFECEICILKRICILYLPSIFEYILHEIPRIRKSLRDEVLNELRKFIENYKIPEIGGTK